MFDGNLTRLELDGTVEHRGGQQFVNGTGFAGDAFERVHRVEPHGFASHPVAGGIAAVFSARGSRDSAYAFGGENPSLRPSIEAGGTAIYDHLGNIVSIVASEMRIVHATGIHIVAPEIVLEGNVRLGSASASRPASAQGTVDTAGAEDVSNLATKVFVE
ncbi:phage baseplate assembly protein domain-containing protein [Oricola thermophila]|uniref:Phage baseplate assembly protein n=1 Tax=Oricola thermophila TaxID=2742145 RepID=A0A6N1VH28_9HYPH|nr:phage baseplate assembly protein [Oricola thermophila]QKV20236.1 phage baseplate assembly protein [Oricola thermophila]